MYKYYKYINVSKAEVALQLMLIHRHIRHNYTGEQMRETLPDTMIGWTQWSCCISNKMNTTWQVTRFFSKIDRTIETNNKRCHGAKLALSVFRPAQKFEFCKNSCQIGPNFFAIHCTIVYCSIWKYYIILHRLPIR